MIPKRFVDKFLSRERKDFRHWKEYKFSKLNAMMAKLPIRPPVWKKLRKHQRVCFLLGARYKSWAFFLDTGCGKTLLSISLMRYFRRTGEGRRFLVLVPNNINIYEWRDEIVKHAPNVKYTLLDGASAEKWAAFKNSDSLIFVTTYMGLLYMVCKESKNKKGKVEMKINESDMSRLIKDIDGLFMDESTAVGGHSSLCHRICKRISSKVAIRFALTGTPFGKDPTPLWAQMRLIDKGHALGETLELFRSAFFREVPNRFSYYPDYVFIKKNAPILNEFIAHRSIEYEADQADLPKLVEQVREVVLPKNSEAQYEALKAEYKEAIRGHHGVRNRQVIHSTFLAMRQLSSGFLGYKDDELGTRAQMEFDDNPKLDMLMSLCTEITPKYKMVVFCDFVFSGSLICRELEKLKIGFTRIYGKTKDSEAVLQRYKNDESCRVLVLNNQCGGFGLNLQIAKYGVYYESPLSPIFRKQTRRRIERQGSSHDKVFIIDLVTKGTEDYRILKNLRDGKNLLEEVMRGDPIKRIRL